LATKHFLVLIVLYPSHSSFFLLRFKVYFIYLWVKYNFDKITTFDILFMGYILLLVCYMGSNLIFIAICKFSSFEFKAYFDKQFN
jgi:hypothetical protein